MQTALVTAIGSFSADVVIRRLHELGLRVVGCDIYARELVVDAMNVDVFYQAPYATKPAEYGAFIEEVCAKESVDLILPLTDVEVDFFRTAAPERTFGGAQVLISGEHALSLCRDKAAMAKFLEHTTSGVRGIKTCLLSECDTMPELPVIVKPLDGRSSQGLSRVYTPSEWQAACAVEDPERYVVQPLIEGRVVTVDVVRSEAGPAVVCVPRRELLRTLNGAGTSVHVFKNDELTAACALLAEEVGIVGCVNFEFIETKDEQEYWFIECNPRFAGGVEFSCMAAYDCVGNHLRAFAGEPIEPLGAYDSCYIARKYEEFVTKVERA